MKGSFYIHFYTPLAWNCDYSIFPPSHSLEFLFLGLILKRLILVWGFMLIKLDMRGWQGNEMGKVGVMREGTRWSVGGMGVWSAEMTCFGKVGVQFAKVPVEANLRSVWLRSKVVVLKRWSSSESWRRAAFTVTIMGYLPPREFDSVCPIWMLTKTTSDSDAGGLRPHFERKTDLKVSFSQPVPQRTVSRISTQPAGTQLTVSLSGLLHGTRHHVLSRWLQNWCTAGRVQGCSWLKLSLKNALTSWSQL